MSKLIKIAYKINIQKSIVCLYTGDNNFKKLKNKAIYNSVDGGNLEIVLTKDVKRLDIKMLSKPRDAPASWHLGG